MSYTFVGSEEDLDNHYMEEIPSECWNDDLLITEDFTIDVLNKSDESKPFEVETVCTISEFMVANDEIADDAIKMVKDMLKDGESKSVKFSTMSGIWKIRLHK